MINTGEIKNRIVQWIADYFKKNASPDTKAVIGISGGKDSSIIAALCVEALGKERVFGVLLPQGRQHDFDVSYDLCKTLGVSYIELNIEKSVNALYDGIIAAGQALNDIAVFNTPARIRMTALYAVSAVICGRVANTGNLSEDYVGYSTKFGDSAGDFSPLSDLTVTEVKAVGYETGLPARFIDKVPLDGLCGKTDEDNLGFSYKILDKYIREGVCEDEVVKREIDKLHAQSRHKYTPLPAFKL
ncbi:MAG: NAD(+) synthase [Oscillospiraceae bacterium]|jgi:NAD+ synthase|nr:NAD(+) synthase [Oscillospiraceae bacterium]